MFLFFLSFSLFECPRQLVSKVARAIVYTHQNSNACAGVCAYDRTHQMEKAVVVAVKGYFGYKTITSQNVSSEAQVKIFFIS